MGSGTRPVQTQLLFSVWFPLSLKHWSPPPLLLALNSFHIFLWSVYLDLDLWTSEVETLLPISMFKIIIVRNEVRRYFAVYFPQSFWSGSGSWGSKCHKFQILLQEKLKCEKDHLWGRIILIFFFIIKRQFYSCKYGTVGSANPVHVKACSIYIHLPRYNTLM